MITVALVFVACIALTELLSRTPLSKPLTGRTRVPWRRARPAAASDPAHGVPDEGSAEADQVRAPAVSEEPATADAMAEAIAR